MAKFDKSYYYVDFSKNDKLTDVQKTSLERIQELYLPIDRAAFLGEYRYLGLITDDEYETMTGIPYRFE
jgi:hypothetical protein